MSETKIAGVPSDKRDEVEAQAQAVAEAQQQAAEAAAQKAVLVAAPVARIVEEPPVPPAAPPAPEKASTSRSVLEEAAAIRAMAEHERDRLHTLGNEYDARLRRERDRDRVSALRSMGATGSLSDAQLLVITPDADPHTAGGKAQLDEWREGNEGLFIAQEGPTIPTPSQLMEGLTTKSSASGLYDEKFLAEMLRQNLGGN
tara:strand:+ start:5828 stop:6430 length:603 start_codon:yes stop_codon:yes gene_type:complete